MPLHVTLRSVGSSNHRQDPNRSMPGVPNEFVEVADLAAASKACRDYIEKHDLGGSNWAGGTIYDDANVEVGRVSYNGRVWPPGPHVNGAEPIWPPTKEETKVADPFEFEKATVEIEGQGWFEISGCLRIAHVTAKDSFGIGGRRHDFMEYVEFSEDGSVDGPNEIKFLTDGRYDLPADNPQALRAIREAVKAWTAEPENFAMILRNEIKDNMRTAAQIERLELPGARALVAKAEDKMAKALRKAEAIQERLNELAGSGPRP